MFTVNSSFSSFSVNDVAKARAFYGDALGFGVEEQMGGLQITLPGGQTVYAYPKPNHEAATFTVLNFEVPDLEGAVRELDGLGISLEKYPSTPEMPVGDDGILRDPESGQGIAWIKDPAGNVLGIMSR